MDVDDSMTVFPNGEGDFGKVDRANGGAFVDEFDDFSRAVEADVFLRFFRASADVRRQNNVWQTEQRIVLRQGL